MALRIFGPVKGAGVQVQERQTAPGITPAPFGITAFVGVTEKGQTNTLNVCSKQRDFVRRCGTYRDDTQLPDAAFDFYGYSGGAGAIYVVRVTDGTEVQAQSYLNSRHPGTGEYLNRATQAHQKKATFLIKAKNGGAWGGREKAVSFAFSAANLGAATLQANSSIFTPDQLVGATLEIGGVTTQTYTVVSNTADTLTVEADSTMSADYNSASDGYAFVYADAPERTANGPGLVLGARNALSYEVVDGELDEAGLFGLKIYVDESLARTYANLSLDPASEWYAPNVINEDPANYEIEVEVQLSGAYTTQTRPAAWYNEYKSYSAGVATTSVCHVSSVYLDTNTSRSVGFVNSFIVPTKCIRGRLELTFTSPTAFTVTAVSQYGVEFRDLPSGAIQTPYFVSLNAATYDAATDFIPSFVVQRGFDAFDVGDKITIDVDPFPVRLDDGTGLLERRKVKYLAENSRTKLTIESNTPNQITFGVIPSVAPQAAGDIAASVSSTAPISFPTPGASTIKLVCDLKGYVELTTGGSAADIATLVSDFNSAAGIVGLPGNLFTNDGDKLVISLDTAYASASEEKGEDQFFAISPTDLTPELNLFPSLNVGTRGDNFRVEGRKELTGGYDGGTPSETDYLNALNLTTSHLNKLKGRQLGLVKIACPGITSTNVQKKGLELAGNLNYQFRVEIPTNLDNETDAIGYINDTIGRSDYGKVFWPSYGNVINPLGAGTVLRTLTGKILGIEAKTAADFEGYHKAGAGLDAKLTDLVTLPLGPDYQIDQEETNPAGLNVIVKKQGNWVLWGDRSMSSNSNWQFAHVREYFSHVENVLLESFDWIIFALNDEQQRRNLAPVFNQYFAREFQKRALAGNSLREAYTLKIDEENNPPSEVALGNMRAEISLRVVGTVERLIISIGQAGVSEG